MRHWIAGAPVPFEAAAQAHPGPMQQRAAVRRRQAEPLADLVGAEAEPVVQNEDLRGTGRQSRRAAGDRIGQLPTFERVIGLACEGGAEAQVRAVTAERVERILLARVADIEVGEPSALVRAPPVGRLVLEDAERPGGQAGIATPDRVALCNREQGFLDEVFGDRRVSGKDTRVSQQAYAQRRQFEVEGSEQGPHE